jgi:hypothetical protein
MMAAAGEMGKVSIHLNFDQETERSCPHGCAAYHFFTVLLCAALHCDSGHLL